MKILVLLLLIYANCLGQPDSIRKVLDDDAIIGVWPDELPQLIGGIDSLLSRLQYPIVAIEHGIEGTVLINITIDTSGIPSKPKIFKGIGYGCDEEAIRLINASRFTPAIQQGRLVKCQIIIPIKFRLPKEE